MKALTLQAAEEDLVDDGNLLVGVILGHAFELGLALGVHVPFTS